MGDEYKCSHQALPDFSWSCWAQPEHRQGLWLFWAWDFFVTVPLCSSHDPCLLAVPLKYPAARPIPRAVFHTKLCSREAPAQLFSFSPGPFPACIPVQPCWARQCGSRSCSASSTSGKARYFIWDHAQIHQFKKNSISTRYEKFSKTLIRGSKLS